MSFPRYPSYKDSGVEWLPNVPTHWAVAPLKRFLRLQSGESITSEQIEVDGRFPVWGGNGVRGFTSSYTHEGSIVLIGRQGALCGNVNYASGCFWASEHAIVSAPLVPVNVRWLGELLRAMDLNQYSVSAAQPGLSVDLIGRLLTILPPLEEQQAIGSFLDRETAKIDALVAEQERLIELLKEKRQAVISHAVTKGLNANAPMRASGIAWLGDVPAHWAVTPLARFTTSSCDGPFGSGLKSEHYTDSGVRVVRLQNIRHSGFDGSNTAYVSTDYYTRDLRGHDVVGGDVLIAGLGDDNNSVGRACVAPHGIEPAMVKADCFRFRLATNMAVPQYVALALSAHAAEDAAVLSSGSTRSRIPLSVMSSRRVALPPIDEQRTIIEFVTRLSAELDDLSSDARRAIVLLCERRSTLISAAVTGQIDIRGLAPLTSDTDSALALHVP